MPNPLTYTYISNVPQGNQQIKDTQEPIKDNFQDIYDLVGINHVQFNTANTFGSHTVVDYFVQATDPSTGANTMALYSKNVEGDANISELFYRYPNDGAVVQLTGVPVSGVSISSTNSPTGSGGNQYNNLTTNSNGIAGYQYLTNGLLMKWGGTTSYFPAASSGSAVFTFPTQNGIPAFTQTPFNMEWSVNLGQSLGSTTPPQGEVYITPLSATTFSINYVATPYPQTVVGAPTYYNWVVNYLAIGV